MGEAILKNIKNFDLAQTFECGQCFRWNFFKNKYIGIIDDKKLIISQKDDNFIFENTTENEVRNLWIPYFDLENDYEKIGKILQNQHPLIKKVYEKCSGIRILKQDPWEILCSFIISQNNNIPRIKGIISRLCENFGKKIEDYYTFPKADVVADLTEKNLEILRCGFRAKYILDAAKKVASEEINLNKIAGLSLFKAKNELMKIKGVGEKVATCVMLYGFHRLEAFPLDVWTTRIMKEYFEGESIEIFGKFAGVAQQYLYHYFRNIKRRGDDNDNVL